MRWATQEADERFAFITSWDSSTRHGLVSVGDMYFYMYKLYDSLSWRVSESIRCHGRGPRGSESAVNMFTDGGGGPPSRPPRAVSSGSRRRGPERSRIRTRG